MRLNVKYDETADAAYISLTSGSETTSFGFTYACDPKEVGGQIHLDFDSDGRLLGIEILQASRLLPKKLLADVPRS
jgi:uncharacterized protein YuzE